MNKLLNNFSFESSNHQSIKSLNINISGIVQGVGFRPFVYQLAYKYHLSGTVINTSEGVSIHIEGTKENLDDFQKELEESAPPLSTITDIKIISCKPTYYKKFLIQKSTQSDNKNTLISPDVSVCDDCLKELFDPDNRRYLYPFINCTNCGPRYTIIKDVPYDRPKTSMHIFNMCYKCLKEYENPLNRRFHAQPNACATCGPYLFLFDSKKNKIRTHDIIQKTISFLKQGCIIAIKGLGGYHLAVDATNYNAVETLRQKKNREEQPFALMANHIETIKTFAFISPNEKQLLISSQRPIVLLKKKNPNHIAETVAPKNNYFGTMLPYTPLHYLLLHYDDDIDVLVMTSGNKSHEPICIDNNEAFDTLSSIADYFLVHNRDIYIRSDDSILKKTVGKTTFLRRSRGYVPIPVFLKNRIPEILACGAGFKSTICLTKENMGFISQHIGDLQNLKTYEFFIKTIDHLTRILDIHPDIIACDMHPDYMSTNYAKKQIDKKIIEVQHHHAHIISCLAENKVDIPVIGLSFDGTGLGTDGNIWGGEVLQVDAHNFTRQAHFSYIPMPGSDKAIKEPWRLGVSYLYQAYQDDLFNLDIPFIKNMGSENIKFIIQMILKQINSPLTSSIGRFFDGIAAIIGLRNQVNFEGQAGIELEMIVNHDINNYYVYDYFDDGTIIIDPGTIIKGIVDDLLNKRNISEISAKFHHTLIKLFTDICMQIRKKIDISSVALSGGVFQNSILLKGILKNLKKENFEVFIHELVPANDGGIALGQAIIAAAKFKEG